MIICMNIGTDGERHITSITYSDNFEPSYEATLAKEAKKYCDEAYIIDFKENEAFIDEVVLRGCRV